MRYAYYREYADEPGLEEIREGEAREKLSRYYISVELAMTELQAGAVLRTPWALYTALPLSERDQPLIRQERQGASR